MGVFLVFTRDWALIVAFLPLLVITSYNRNFTGRNDADPVIHVFVASPGIVTTMTFTGPLMFNHSLVRTASRSSSPSPLACELPLPGYDPGWDAFRPPAADSASTLTPSGPPRCAFLYA